MSQIILRPATPDDLPAIAEYGVINSSDMPIYSIGLAGCDARSVSLARTKHFFAQPYYHFTVAVLASSPSTVVGYICAKDSGDLVEVPFKPDLPEGANLEFFGYFMGTSDEHKNTLPIKGLPELEMLDVSPEYQRKGVGKLLVKEMLKEVDRRGERCYVHSSRMGKGLYEKFGWRAFEESGWGIDLSKFGEEKLYVSWDMVREVRGGVGAVELA
ncbi:acyl-CoA N-acyltransferase [Stipitochalara longipes BDJ]|nr:acyl-CoA N-acyltransferase [Stipitochalara longipes BDJ]